MKKVQLICQNTSNSGEITTVTYILESNNTNIDEKEAKEWLNEKLSDYSNQFER